MKLSRHKGHWRRIVSIPEEQMELPQLLLKDYLIHSFNNFKINHSSSSFWKTCFPLPAKIPVKTQSHVGHWVGHATYLWIGSKLWIPRTVAFKFIRCYAVILIVYFIICRSYEISIICWSKVVGRQVVRELFCKMIRAVIHLLNEQLQRRCYNEN